MAYSENLFDIIAFGKCEDPYTKNDYIVKPVLSGHSQKDQKWFSRPNIVLMQVKSIAECSKGSILQYI